MSWLTVILLAAVTFGAAAFVLRVQKGGWTLLGATLLFGLTGYALQGSPDLDSSPTSASERQTLEGELLITARREYFDTAQLPSRWILTGDGFARQGDFERASGFYRSATQENPRDIEAWLALGVSLVEHAEGNLTPAALFAFERAHALNEKNGGAYYFLGFAWLRAGQPGRTRELWREALVNAPEEAPWRETLGMRLMQLEAMLQQGSAPQNGQ